MSDLKIETSRRGTQTVVVSLVGSAGVGTGELLQQHVKHLITAKPSLVVWDCARLSFLTSVGITAMIELHQALRSQGGRSVIAGATGNVRDVLKSQNLEDVIPMHATVADAVKGGAPGSQSG